MQVGATKASWNGKHYVAFYYRNECIGSIKFSKLTSVEVF